MWELIPNRYVGPIEFGKPISDYVKSLNLINEGRDLITKSIEYRNFDEDVYVSTELGLVVSVLICSALKYKNENLIGMNDEKLFQHLEKLPDEVSDNILYDNGDIGYFCDFYKLGLTVDLQRKDNYDEVTSVSCYSNRSVE